MRIGQIILRVSNLDRSLGFWSDTFGLTPIMRLGTFASLDGGGIELTLNEVAERPDDGSLTEIVFEVDDVMSAHTELASRGVPFEVEPRAVTSDGARELWAAHFHDPDGHLASVVGWIDS
jgi:catechol 2,3-dioxygenase-like lactoylglutathione lyase family enzyme